ncbi:unnamed protein product [Effrenium voratum]|nr:unnamed protein product [Effrenium voratum]
MAEEPRVHGGDLDLDVKDKAEVVPFTRSKKPKLTHQVFFEEKGLKKVIRDFPKLKFKGKGNEFEDLKALMAAYKKWFKELYPFQDDLEDLIWKSRAVLEQKEKTELGVESDPRHQLHLLRYQYKSQKVESDITAREAFGFGSASKPAEVPEEGFGPTEEMFEEEDVFGFGGME